MKFNSTRFVALLLGAAAALCAAPVTETTPVYAEPNPAAPALAALAPGTEPVIAPGVDAPAGWTAVLVTGTHDVYTANRDVTKSLDVRVGASYLTQPEADSPVLGVAEKGDKTEIIDYRGKWTKFRLTKAFTGYIKTPAPVVSPIVPAPEAAPRVTTDAPPPAPVPAQPAVVAVGKAAPVGDGGSSALPRLFQGKFASTYSPFRPRRPYAYQLNDDAGARYAYVDVSKLLATEQLNRYLDRTVVVYGTAKAVPGSKDMVVVAESLQLR